MDLQDFQVRTLDDYGSYRDLFSQEHEKLSLTCICLLLSNSPGQVKIAFRGLRKDYLTSRLAKDSEAIQEPELLSRLFYFGDKAKHFAQENEMLDNSKWLKTIDDTSQASNKEVFSKLKGLGTSKNSRVIDFFKSNPNFFAFFADNKNKAMFSDALAKLGQEARDYYLSVLHTAGKVGVSDKSLLVSTSEKYSVARRFAGRISDHPFVLIAVVRSAARKQGHLKQLLANQGLPTLPPTSQIFSEQVELSSRGGLLPHNILGVVKPRMRDIVINPHIFSDLNRKINLATDPLIIDQSEFEANVARKTNYTRWYYTYDEDYYLHGGAIKRPGD